MPEQTTSQSQGSNQPTRLRRSSRIAAGVLGVLSLLVLPVVVASLRGGDRLYAVTANLVCSAVFLYAAWSGTSPAFLDHPEMMWNWIARKFRRR